MFGGLLVLGKTYLCQSLYLNCQNLSSYLASLTDKCQRVSKSRRIYELRLTSCELRWNCKLRVMSSTLKLRVTEKNASYQNVLWVKLWKCVLLEKIASCLGNAG